MGWRAQSDKCTWQLAASAVKGSEEPLAYIHRETQELAAIAGHPEVGGPWEAAGGENVGREQAAQDPNIGFKEGDLWGTIPRQQVG